MNQLLTWVMLMPVIYEPLSSVAGRYIIEKWSNCLHSRSVAFVPRLDMDWRCSGDEDMLAGVVITAQMSPNCEREDDDDDDDLLARTIAS
jgi:hypothetical protein